jgi:hypothetical protein
VTAAQDVVGLIPEIGTENSIKSTVIATEFIFPLISNILA